MLPRTPSTSAPSLKGRSISHRSETSNRQSNGRKPPLTLDQPSRLPFPAVARGRAPRNEDAQMPDAPHVPAAPERAPLSYEEMKLDRLDAVMGQARALRSTY